MTVTEAARRLKLTRQGVHFLITTGKLKASKRRDTWGKEFYDIPASELRKRERKAVGE